MIKEEVRMIEGIERRRKERQDFVDSLLRGLYEKDEAFMLDVAGSLIKCLRTWRMPVLPGAERTVLEIQKFSRTSAEGVVILAEVIKKLTRSAMLPLYNALVRQELFESELLVGKITDKND
jgi:hypothetical protein